MKKKYRLGTTSYIVPDNIIPNARYLAGKVQDIQLILFQSDDIALPDSDDVKTLIDIAAPHDLNYSIHFPLDCVLGADEPLRTKSVNTSIEIINTTLALDPSVYIVHFNPDNCDHQAHTPSDNLQRWHDNNRRSMEEIIAATNVPPEKFCIETLFYPLAMVDDIIDAMELSVCLDIGHIILSGASVEKHLDRYLQKVRSIHLHGTSGPKDHLDISHLDPATLDLILTRIDNLDINLTIEVFNEPDFLKSMEVLDEYYL